MRYFSAFTGVGGFDLGMPEDWECVGHSEIDKNAIKVLRYRYKDVRNYGNIEKINYEELPDFDVLIGGSPCQDVSMAGNRKGLNGVRSRLFFSFIAILKSKMPGYFIFENVKGLLSSNGGRDFATVVSQFTEAGYDIWWQLLDATDFGIPQHRERIFIMGTLRGTGKVVRKIFFNTGGNRSHTNLPGQQQHTNTITRRYRDSQSTGSYIIENQLNSERQRMYDGLNIRYLTPLECERIMGWPDNWTKYGIDDHCNTVELTDSARYNLIGNGVVPQIVRAIIRTIKDEESE